MRHAETSPHPADAAALIVAVDAQGALAALFAVAQNAGVNPSQLDYLATPLRKRSAPALLRTLFSPDMRVANAAKKALRQVAAIASCQTTHWMATIRAALSLRSGARINRSILLRNLLSRLAEILHLVVKQAASTKSLASSNLHRKPTSRSSLTSLVIRPRPSLSSERRAQERYGLRYDWNLFNYLFRWTASKPLPPRSISKLTTESDNLEKRTKRRFRTETTYGRRHPSRGDSLDDLHSNTSTGAYSTGASYPGSLFSSITDTGHSSSSRTNSTPPRRTGATIKRDAATAMYIFERLLAKRTNPELEDRIEVITTLADIASVTFSGHYASLHKIENAEQYCTSMAAVFRKHAQRIYSVVLDILFRPVREADANRIGVFSFHETGIADFGMDAPFTRRRLSEFPQSAICLPNMDCTGLAAVSCNSLLKVFLRFVPQVCSQRMALLTGTINSAFLHSSEALQRTQDGTSWEVSKIVSAVDALTVLVSVIPHSVESALELIIREPVTLRLVIETCIRSVSATGRLLAQNTARSSAPKLSDEGTLDSLRSWQSLVKILPGTSSWSGTPSYSSSILFLAQVARRAALISVVQGLRKERYTGRTGDCSISDETYPSVSTLNSSVTVGSVSIEDNNGSAPSSTTANAFGFDSDEENVLVAELQKSIITMINVQGTCPGDVFFELYRTVVYLYANDLKKHNQVRSKSTPEMKSGAGPSHNYSKKVLVDNGEKAKGRIAPPMKERRSQSDEDAKGILVENIAVDGQLPSRALRRAVMSSEIDLGEYFDSGQPPSLQHMRSHQTGLPPGMHTFEEFSHAIAIIIGTLSSKTIIENFEDPHEAAAMISRDVQKSGSPYLKRVHKRSKAILRRDSLHQDHDWRSVCFEERIRQLEEQVASLKIMVQKSLEERESMGRRKSFSKLLGRSNDHGLRKAKSQEIAQGETRCCC